MSERLGIVGCGTIGAGLAKLAAESGFPDTVVWARRETELEHGRTTTELAELEGCTFVIEAISEDAAVKSDVYGRLRLADGTILATTTSSLSVNELAGLSGRPERFCALHVFNPVHKMELVELAFPEAAGEDTRARALALCEALGKTAVEVPDRPGFVVNRLLFPYLFDAVRMLEIASPQAVDTCMRLGANMPMGPLELLDFVGLDVALAIGEQIGVDVPDEVRRLVDDGALGRKAGRGFYEY